MLDASNCSQKNQTFEDSLREQLSHAVYLSICARIVI